MSEKVAVILQARMSSSRLPGKVLEDIAGRPMLQFIVERLKRSSCVDQIILATTNNPSDDALAELNDELGLLIVRGSQRDVLARYVHSATQTDAKVLVRITGDCPFVDPDLLDQMITEFQANTHIDYLSNCALPSYPDGLDIEIFSREALLLAGIECRDLVQREHVTPWIRESGLFCIAYKQNDVDLSGLSNEAISCHACSEGTFTW